MSLRERSRRQGGVALVVALAFLLLLSVIVVGFMLSVRSDLSSARSYAAGVTVRQLADTAVSIVQGQISDGTRSYEIPADPANQVAGSGARLTWSSQPGLIRTFDQNGKSHRSFKLYSARNMVEDTGVDYVPSERLATEVPSDWAAKIALYTDLNSPVLVPDPAGKIERDGRRLSANFPIANPIALGRVDGFKLNLSGAAGDPRFTPPPVPGYGGPPSISDTYDLGSAAVAAGKTANPAPMPVQWMYVLKNGKVTAPDGATADGKGVYWSTTLPESIRPTESNPIVGRIAFWTDDETCKLNINTASEGIFWGRAWGTADVATSPYGERQLQQRIPLRGEYQRFPGHPATTCLSPVFGASGPGLTPLVAAMRAPVADAVTAAYYDGTLRRYYDLAPRIGQGGTQGGTLQTYGAAPAVPVQLDQNRLYASIDELIFAAPDGPRSDQTPAEDQARDADGGPTFNTGNPLLKRAELEAAKFFLTATSRAPEVNVFGKPRVALWNLQQERDPNAGKISDSGGNRPANCPTRPRNPQDELLGFCSTVGGLPYYFQRHSIYLGDSVNNRAAGGRTKGANGLAVPFLQLPPSFVMPSSQSPSLDWLAAGIGPRGRSRNQDLYQYLQALTSEPIPGWGRAFTQKYSVSERDQFLTEMVDHLRSGTNCYAQDIKKVPAKGVADVRYEYAPSRRMPDAVSGETQITPLVIPPNTPGAGTKGFGRFPTVTEAMLVFYATAFDQPEPATERKPKKMRVPLALEPYSPTSGSWTWSPLVRYVVKGLENFWVNGKPLTWGPVPVKQKSLVNFVTSRCGYGSGSAHNTAHTGTFAAFRRWNGPGNDETKIVPPSGFAAYDPEKNYPFVSDEIDVTGAARFTFESVGEITVEIHTGYANEATAETLVQTIRLKFPKASWRVPKDPRTVGKGTYVDYNERIGKDQFELALSCDTARSVEVDPFGPSGGDLRLVAGLPTVPSNFYAPYPGGADGKGYADPDTALVHSFRNGNAGSVGGKIHGDLVDPTMGGPSRSPGDPIVARGLKGAWLAKGVPGDWDNGPIDHPDGALINKPDDYYGSGDNWDAQIVTPNRQVFGPSVFGSLPVGVSATNPKPWRTLLFCSNPAAGALHPGFASPRDHLLLDFFTMPVVEPYAISEPLSTAGKVNLNCELAPFTYIRRDTALRGVLKSTRIMAIPNTGSGGSAPLRRALDADETLAAFHERFAAKTGSAAYKGGAGPFRTASEICDMPLVPVGAKLAEVKVSWWKNYLLTGDNAREFPYGHIYSRVTTKSNTFTVHMRVQTLRQVPPPAGSSADRAQWFAEWREAAGITQGGGPRGRDEVVSEYRGSTTLERFVDAGDPNLPDFANATNAAKTLDEYYRFRVIGTKRFAP